VSVVVSTYNRPARLALLLDGLRAQTLARDAFEVVIVDNGSEPPTAAVLAAERRRGELPLRTVRNERTLGPAGGRNTGWRAAHGEVIAFTDDDCRPDPEWLASGLAVCDEHRGAIVQGPTRPNPAERADEGLLSHTISIERLGPLYETCNVFYPRELLEALGGFDERFGVRPGGEDTDLAWRAIGSGAATEFAPRALVLHAVERIGARGMLRLAARWSASIRVFAEHPQTRTALYRGSFWNFWHYLMWRTILTLATPTPPWLRRMIVMRHLQEMAPRARLHGSGPAAIPFLLVHDAVECVAVARGALRYRVLVL
jgi:GT2 family glycosyltransferase